MPSTFDQILSLVKEAATHGVPEVDEHASPKAIGVVAEDLVAVCTALFNNPTAYFDMLSSVTGIDNGPEAGSLEVVYNLYSIPFHLSVMLKVKLSRDQPVIDSVAHLWKTADWHEREIFDMFGIVFRNHPDLRRILMPADWQGYPLRKDYKHADTYRNIKIDY